MSNTKAYKPRYKHTPLGWIPEEWEVFTIDELLEKKILTGHLDGNHGGLYPRAEEFVSEGVPYISANNFADGYVKFDECKYLSPEKAKQFKKGVAKNGDVLFAHNATVGPVAILNTKLDFVILSTTATYFRCNDQVLSNLYLREFFTSGYFVQQYERVMKQSTRNQVPITTQRLFYTILPTIVEQNAIASILSTWDEAIQKTQQLIEQLKKRNKGLMQQLLTGKNRLKGFSGKWAKVPMKEIFERVQRKSDVGSEDLDVLTISGRFGFMSQNEKFNRVIAGSQLKNYVLLRNGEFSYNKGNSNAYQYGCVFRLDEFKQALVPNVYISFRAIKEIDTTFYAHYFRHDLLKPELTKIISSGARMDGLLNVSADDYFAIKVPMPPIDEQTAIGKVLTVAQMEQKLQEQQLTTLQEQKKGLMQMLLSGEVRVKTNINQHV